MAADDDSQVLHLGVQRRPEWVVLARISGICRRFRRTLPEYIR